MASGARRRRRRDAAETRRRKVTGAALKKHVKRQRMLRPTAAVIVVVAVVVAAVVARPVPSFLILLFGAGLAGFALLTAGKTCPVCRTELVIGEGKVKCERCRVAADLPR